MSKVDLKELGDDELLQELARRRVSRFGGSAQVAEGHSEQLGESVSRITFEAWLRNESGKESYAPHPCPRCSKMTPVRAKARERVLRAVSGEVRYKRAYHYCSTCKHGFCPLDDRLGLPSEGNVTPEMERRLLDFGVHDTFEQSAKRWAVHYSQPVSENLIRRVVERVGIALSDLSLDEVQRRALPARQAPPSVLVVEVDGTMVSTRDTDSWRETKVGTVVRQDCYLPTWEASRGQVTEARYAAHLGGVEEFGRRLDALLRAEHVDHVDKLAWVGDGAPWIWNLADEIAPKALQILDWFHAIEAASDCAKVVLGASDPCVPLFVDRVAALLRVSDADELIRELQACGFQTRSKPAREAITRLIGYYERNKKRMDYLSFVAQGLPIGSGIAEASNRHVIQTRMKRAGQHWNSTRADRMANLRALLATTGPTRLHETIRPAA